MNQLNSIILEGNICREVEVKNTANSYSLATFPVAVNRYYKKDDGTFEQEVSYFDIEAWGNVAKVISGKASKGQGVRVVGRLKQNRWKDQNGRNQSKVTVVAEHIDLKPRSEKNEGKPVPHEEKADVKTSKTKTFDRAQLFGNPAETEPAPEEDFATF